MRRHPGPSHRQPKSKASVIAASFILALLVVIAVAARFSGSQDRVTYPLESEFGESYLQTALLSEESHSVFPQPPPSVSETTSVLSSPEKPKPIIAPKLQVNVLSSFSVSPSTASAPSSPEQVAFVQGYEQLRPILSVTSYIPLNHQPVRGIIMPAGKSLRLGSAYVAVQLLREELQCDLPIEIWHIAGEIDAHTKAVFEVKRAVLVHVLNTTNLVAVRQAPCFRLLMFRHQSLKGHCITDMSKLEILGNKLLTSLLRCRQASVV